MTASIYPVHRSGSMSLVNIYIHAVKRTDTFNIRVALSDGNVDVSDHSETAPDGVLRRRVSDWVPQLVDGVHHKVYLPATAHGACLCQPHEDLAMSDPTYDIWVSVSFAAPPTDVHRVAVVVPQFGTISDVPVV